MSDTKDIKVVVEDDTLICSIPLRNPDGDHTKAKIICYGALKLAEESASVYYMHKEMQRRMLQKNNGIIKPGMA